MMLYYKLLMPFVLIEETGEYENFEYKIISTYENEEDAEFVRDILNYKEERRTHSYPSSKFKIELADEKRPFFDKTKAFGDICKEIDNFYDEIERKDRNFNKQLQEENETKKLELKNIQLDNLKEQIYKFLDDDGDENINSEKKRQIIENVMPMIKQYILHHIDERIDNWYEQNR